MKLPQEIKSKHRIRDFKICQLYIDGLRPQQIKTFGRKFKISVRRIEQILYENAAYVNPRVPWSKTKRIHTIQKWIGKKKSKRDPADLIEQLRKEAEGDRALNINVDASTKTSILQVGKLSKDMKPEEVKEVDKLFRSVMERRNKNGITGDRQTVK